MLETIKNFPKQFEYRPEISNGKGLKNYNAYITAGMGGSQLAPMLYYSWQPLANLAMHRDYGLPNIPDAILKKSLTVAISCSGDTEETIDAFQKARKKKFPVAAIAKGGKLLELAKKYKTPFIQLPENDIQPRAAVGLMLQALLALMGREKELKQTSKLATTLDALGAERIGMELSERVQQIPVFYSSNQNEAIAYFWKINCNETGKIPAFYNTLPELNHNEMQGFDPNPATKELTNKFHFLLLRDDNDHPRIAGRMNALHHILEENRLRVDTVMLEGNNRIHQIANSLLIAQWFAYYTAIRNNVSPDGVPAIERFKKMIEGSPLEDAQGKLNA